MKILAFTDPHGDVQDAEKIVRLADMVNPEIIVCAGDFSLFGNNWRGFFQTLSQMRRKVYAIGGNHEADALMHSLEAEYPFFMDVAYTTVEDRGVLIGGVPGYDRDFWPSRRSDEDAVNLAREIWYRRDRMKPFIFLTHYPPAGAVDGLSIPTPDAGGSATIASIIRAIKPDLVVAGHYHQEFGHWGQVGPAWIVNPGPSGHILTLGHRTGQALISLAEETHDDAE